MSTSPLKGSIADQVTDGLNDLLYELTFVKVSESYDDSSGTTTTTTAEYTCAGFVGEFSKNAVSEGLVQADDSKILILQNTLEDSNGNTIEPEPGDRIKDDGTTYTIPEGEGAVRKDPADATWTVQARG